MYSKVENQPKAKTQMFLIKDDDKKVLKTILNNFDLNISFSSIPMPKEKNKVERYKEMHKEIKKAIKHYSETTESHQYQTMIDWKSSTCYFFYASQKSHQENNIIDDILSQDIDLKRTLCSLFSLALKSKIITEVSEEYDIPPSFYGDEFYIGTKPQGNKTNSDNKLKIDTFQPNLFFSEKSYLSFHLKNKTFEAELADLNLIESEEYNNIMFRTKSGVFKANSDHEINANRFNQTKFMQYKDYYAECKNYSLNFLHKHFIELLNNLQISFEEVFFEANHIIKEFIFIEPNIEREIVLFDDYRYEKNEYDFKDDFINQIKNYLNITKNRTTDKKLSIKDLDSNFNYLCINKSYAKNGTSITVKGLDDDKKDYLNTSLQAYDLHLKDKTKEFDFYTTLKISNMKQQDRIVTQGLNIKGIVKEHKDTKEPVYKEINENKLKKIKKELWLKECIFHQKKIDDIDLFDGEYTLFFTRNTISKNKKTNRISVVDIKINDKTLYILKNKIYSDSEMFNFEYSKSIMSKIDVTRYNDSFYIYDKKNDIVLTSYTSINVPRIIGNAKFNNIDYLLENDDLMKTNKPDISPLPYYLTPKKNKQSNFVFIQETEDNLYYFVSQKGNPNISFDKQKLIYSVLTLNSENNKVKELEQEVTQLFLSSFTDDILLNNEVSKSSILEKIAKEFLLE